MPMIRVSSKLSVVRSASSQIYYDDKCDSIDICDYDIDIPISGTVYEFTDGSHNVILDEETNNSLNSGVEVQDAEEALFDAYQSKLIMVKETV